MKMCKNIYCTMASAVNMTSQNQSTENNLCNIISLRVCLATIQVHYLTLNNLRKEKLKSQAFHHALAHREDAFVR